MNWLIKVAYVVVGLMLSLSASASGAGITTSEYRNDARPVVNVAGESKMAAGESSAKSPAPVQSASPPKVILSIPTSFGDVVQVVHAEDEHGDTIPEARYKSSRVSISLFDDDIELEAMLRVGGQDLIILSAPPQAKGVGLPPSYTVLLVTAQQITRISNDEFFTEDDTFNFQKIEDEVRFDLGNDKRRKKSAVYRDGKITVRLETAILPKDDCAVVLKTVAECTKIDADCTNDGIARYFPTDVQQYFSKLGNAATVFSTDKFYELCRQFCTSKTYSVKAARLPLCGY